VAAAFTATLTLPSVQRNCKITSTEQRSP